MTCVGCNGPRIAPQLLVCFVCNTATGLDVLAVANRLFHTARMPSPSPARRPSSASTLARWLEPIAGSLWMLFVVWTIIVAAVWLSGFGDAPRGEGPIAHA